MAQNKTYRFKKADNANEALAQIAAANQDSKKPYKFQNKNDGANTTIILGGLLVLILLEILNTPLTPHIDVLSMQTWIL